MTREEESKDTAIRGKGLNSCSHIQSKPQKKLKWAREPLKIKFRLKVKFSLSRDR